MQSLFSSAPGPFRWWIVPVAYIGHLVVLLGMSMTGLPAALGQIAIFLGYAALATLLAVLVVRSAPGRALGVQPPARPLAVIAVAIAATVITSLIERLGAGFSSDIAQSTTKVLTEMGWGTGRGTDLLLIFTICCAAPIGEEAIFRGLIFRGLHDSLRRLGGGLGSPVAAFGLAAAVSAFIFAQSHGGAGQEPSVLIAIFLSGIVYALCYALTGSLWAPVLAHGLNNTVAFAGAVFGAEQVSLLNQIAVLIMPFLTWALLWFWGRVS
ncbi:MAG: hypothetical protein CSA72_03710 [Rhodobacterales bacterium]|nr:MAG: hypothetical protein CSA72_03710 [Rhodobacterales bacterium]